MSWKVATHFGNIDRVRQGIKRYHLPIDFYRPVVRVPIQRRGLTLWVTSPLMFDYIFVKEFDRIQPGKIVALIPIRWVCFRSGIASVSDEVIEAMRFTTQKMEIAEKEKLTNNFGDINSGKNAIITSGVFGGVYGKVLSSGPKGTAYIEVPFLGKATRCRVNINEITVIESQYAAN